MVGTNTLCNAIEVNLQPKRFLMSYGIFLNTSERLKQHTFFMITTFLFKICSLYLFRAALCKLIFELHKDVLFNCRAVLALAPWALHKQLGLTLFNVVLPKEPR
jgi:hypothetical protein